MTFMSPSSPEVAGLPMIVESSTKDHVDRLSRRESLDPWFFLGFVTGKECKK